MDNLISIADAPFKYRSSMKNWHVNANVRSKPRRIVQKGLTGENKFFSPELVPISQHPIVLSYGEELMDQLITLHLYRYLDFTTALENEVVNPVAMKIAQGVSDIDFPKGMRDDAYKLYCDEAYHALYSLDLKRQVESLSGIDCMPLRPPQFMTELKGLKASLNREDWDIAELFFVIASETMISRILSQVPDDEYVFAAVRHTIRDHAEDEARHHVFFASVLNFVWPRRSERQKLLMGRITPYFVHIFLKPDFGAMFSELLTAGLSNTEGYQIIKDCYLPDEIKASIRISSQDLVCHFRRCGALELVEVKKAFKEFSLAI